MIAAPADGGGGGGAAERFGVNDFVMDMWFPSIVLLFFK